VIDGVFGLDLEGRVLDLGLEDYDLGLGQLFTPSSINW